MAFSYKATNNGFSLDNTYFINEFEYTFLL